MKNATITNTVYGVKETRNIAEIFIDEICHVLSRPEQYDVMWVDRQCARYQEITGNIVWVETYTEGWWLVTIYEDADLKNKVIARFTPKHL